MCFSGMGSSNRRRFLQSVSAATVAGFAGCSEVIGGGNGGSEGTITTQLPEGTIHYPWGEAALDNGFFEDAGVDLEIEYTPFNSQVQSITNDAIDVGLMSMMPYIGHYNRGEDLVTFGWNGSLQSVNALYTRADSEFESIQDLEGETIGVWSWGSSTVQAFQAVVADETGLRLREDFDTTTAAPPALLGLLNDGEADGIINVSGLTITMESQPDQFRNLTQLNQMWQDRTGHTLPLTSWWCYSDWYENNEDAAAGLLEGARNATQYWRENTAEILEEYGETAGIDDEDKIQVVDDWTDNGEVFYDQYDQEYVDATWEFVQLMNDYEFIDEVPDQDEIIRDPR